MSSTSLLMSARAAPRLRTQDDKPYRSTKLHVKISEAKNLPAKDMNGLSDPYCVLVVDDEIVARTSTIWKDLNPFFGEDFFVDLAQDFQEVAVYVYDQDKLKSDDAIGKVSFSRKQVEEIANGMDSWYTLVRVCKETEVCGEVFLKLLLSETATGLDELTVTVAHARDLKDSYPDVLVIVSLDAARVSTERSKSGRFAVWNQSFIFERAKLGPELRITVRSGSGLGTTFVGEAVVSLVGLQRDFPRNEWVRLRPRPKDLEGLAEGNGSIRLSMKYTHELILPLPSYSSLIDFVVANVQSPDAIEHGLVSILEELVAERDQQMGIDREQVARTLIRILLRRNSCTPLLRHLNGLEIARTREYSTLFRGNSMATKCTDQFMKIVGLRYLNETLKPIIDQIFHEKKECEIDPTKLPPKNAREVIHKHSLSLISYLEMVLARIFESADRCPHIMRLVFKHLQQSVREKNSSSGAAAADPDSNATYIVVSGFLFLRFLAPAVLSPKLFGIRDELADARTSRTLTLLAKALQIAGNLGSTIGSGKEPYMEPLYPTLKGSVERVKLFIDRICAVKETDEADLAGGEAAAVGDVTLMEGTLLHRDATAKALKKKEVCLTTRSLVISGGGKDETKDAIPISCIVDVERIDAAAISQKHALQIICAGRPSLCLAFSSAAELTQWLQTFRKCLRLSPHQQLSSFHAGICREGKWTCCKGRGDEATACSKSHASACIDQFSDNPAPEVWAHKLFAMLLSGKPKLEARYRSDVTTPGAEARRAHVAALVAIVDDINLQHLLQQDSADMGEAL